MYDVIVVGAGAAGLTAAIYTCRKKLKTAIISVDVGGQAWIVADRSDEEDDPGSRLRSRDAPCDGDDIWPFGFDARCQIFELFAIQRRADERRDLTAKAGTQLVERQTRDFDGFDGHAVGRVGFLCAGGPPGRPEQDNEQEECSHAPHA